MHLYNTITFHLIIIGECCKRKICITRILLFHLLMKHTGSSFPYKMQRERELVKAFKQELAQCKHISMNKVFERVVKHPCSRFWVSEERAAIAVSAMLRGCDVVFANGMKRQMYRELFRRYNEMRAQNKGLPLSRIIFRIVNSPAPHFYLSASQAKIIINAARKRHVVKW